MHIGTGNDEYLSKLDPERIIRMVKDAGAQTVLVKCHPWSGYTYYESKFSEMHPSLKKMDLDYTRTIVELARKEGLNVKAYFTQGFDNYVYDNHPEWRCKNQNGQDSRDGVMPMDAVHYRKLRYGNVCLNNKEYLEYSKNCVREMISLCHFDSIFLDMPSWPFFVCYCPSCREKYRQETGLELPETVNWDDPVFRDFQYRREVWAAEFAMEMTKAVKETDPLCTCEHNQQAIIYTWAGGNSDLVNEASDYVSADTYDSYFEQSFFCKYFKNLSKSLPYVFISGRCKNLMLHTSTKAADEFKRQGFIALLHNAAYSICDGINPNGTYCEDIYTGPIKESFAATKPYEKYISGDLLHNAAVWYPSHCKYDREDNGKRVFEAGWKQPPQSKFYVSKVNSGRLLRMEGIPYDVIPSKKLKSLKDDLLIISSVANIRDEEMTDIESYIMNGGNVYISGKPGHPRFLELLEAEYEGDTEYWTTYMNPTESGKRFFKGFHKDNPAVAAVQSMLTFKGEYETLATLALPYTKPMDYEYASIHSDPPGIFTDRPCAILKKVGKGQILWVGGEIENAEYYNGKMIVARMFRSLVNTLCFEAETPQGSEIMSWKKDGKQYLAAVNEIDDMPAAPIYGAKAILPYEAKSVRLLNSDKSLDVVRKNGKTEITFPVFNLFEMAEIEK